MGGKVVRNEGLV